jgi:ATP-dependent Clp protease protease subunit
MVNNNLKVNKPIIINVYGDIDDNMAESFHNSMSAAQETGQPIIPIIIDTYGGSVYALLRMIDTIKSSKVPVATIVIGKAMSAGAILLSCGKEGFRYASPYSTILIHEVSSIAEGKLSEIKSSVEELKRLNQILFELTATNIGKDKSYILDLINKKEHADWFLTPEQALDYGLVNHIGIPDLEVEIRVGVNLIIN